jgi:hypothetical protein
VGGKALSTLGERTLQPRRRPRDLERGSPLSRQASLPLLYFNLMLEMIVANALIMVIGGKFVQSCKSYRIGFQSKSIVTAS